MRIRQSLVVLLLTLIIQISFAHRCERIITLSPALTTIIDEMGLAENLVGHSEYSLLPKGLNSVEVGSYFNLNLEQLYRLKPTMIFLQQSEEGKTVAKMKKLGLPVETVLLNTLDEIEASYANIRAACGFTDDEFIGGDTLATSGLSAQKNRLTDQGKGLVFYGDGRAYELDVPTLAVGKSFHRDLFNYLGLTLLYDGPLNAPTLNSEALFALNPDWIIILNSDSAANYDTLEQLTVRNIEVKWPRLEGMNAVKNGQVYELKGYWSMMPTPRAMESIANQVITVLDQSESPNSIDKQKENIQ